jgi:hypothetical protein
MKRLVRSVLLVALTSIEASALISAIEFNSTSKETDWAASFGGGSLTITSVPSAFTGHVGLSTDNAIIQSFKGNGEILAGFGFQVSSIASDWTLWLLDYGSNPDRIDAAAEFNSKGTNDALFSDVFSLGSGGDRQVYLDFGGTSNVPLSADRHYAIVLQTSSGSFLDRSANDAFLDGAARSGTISASTGSWNALGGGARSLNFGLYTSPIPEPSSSALIASSILLLAVGVRRRRR